MGDAAPIDATADARDCCLIAMATYQSPPRRSEDTSRWRDSPRDVSNPSEDIPRRRQHLQSTHAHHLQAILRSHGSPNHLKNMLGKLHPGRAPATVPDLQTTSRRAAQPAAVIGTWSNDQGTSSTRRSKQVPRSVLGLHTHHEKAGVTQASRWRTRTVTRVRSSRSASSTRRPLFRKPRGHAVQRQPLRSRPAR